jgi:hypothetical protein
MHKEESVHDKNFHEQTSLGTACAPPYRSHAFKAARAPKAVAAKPNPAAIAPDYVMREQQVMITHLKEMQQNACQPLNHAETGLLRLPTHYSSK